MGKIIGIDISQLAYQNTGVSNYLENLVLKMVENNRHEFVLFFSSLRGVVPLSIREVTKRENVTLKIVKIPPTFLNAMWNVAHKVPVEKFIGPVDMFITSDWTEPPTRSAKKGTIIYDLIVYKHPKETAQKIVNVQKRKLKWVKKESDVVFCISNSTKNDVSELLGIDKKNLVVVYPGY